MTSASQQPITGVVLVAPGGVSGPAATELAALLQWRALPPQPAVQHDPAPVLAELQRQPAGWLWPLPLDPGADLEAPGCWADQLGAWRQPVLLLIPAATPVARAYTALLQAAAVPLLGLVQLGGSWSAERRRQDGLPWLGWLPEQGAGRPGSDAEQAVLELRLSLQRRQFGHGVAAPLSN